MTTDEGPLTKVYRLYSMIEQAPMRMISPEKETGKSKFPVFLFWTIFLPIALLYVLLYLLWGILLCLAIWFTWRGRSVLFVYSNSPIWKDYIENEIIPVIKNQAIILNWSERKTWKRSLPVLAFQYFGKDRNFNPMAVVFRPFHLVKTDRFYEAFKDFKHGDPQRVEEIQKGLFDCIGVLFT